MGSLKSGEGLCSPWPRIDWSLLGIFAHEPKKRVQLREWTKDGQTDPTADRQTAVAHQTNTTSPGAAVSAFGRHQIRVPLFVSLFAEGQSRTAGYATCSLLVEGTSRTTYFGFESLPMH